MFSPRTIFILLGFPEYANFHKILLILLIHRWCEFFISKIFTLQATFGVKLLSYI